VQGAWFNSNIGALAMNVDVNLRELISEQAIQIYGQKLIIEALERELKKYQESKNAESEKPQG
jgi:hypothetical protein